MTLMNEAHWIYSERRASQGDSEDEHPQHSDVIQVLDQDRSMEEIEDVSPPSNNYNYPQLQGAHRE